MKLKNILVALSVLLFITSCIKEDHYGQSGIANIKLIEVSNQSANAVINVASATVTIEIPGGVDLTKITLKVLEISSFATSKTKVGANFDLSQNETITLISENGTERVWTISAFVASVTPQLETGNLDLWYKTSTGYYEPGASATKTIWATGNRGTQLLNKLATIPEDLGGGNLAAKMITLSNGTLGNVVGTPISAGSLFTGLFNAVNIDPANPSSATEFGSLFSGKPTKIRLTYSYEPGTVNKNKAGAVLGYGDACDIYALLEVRLNDTIRRLGTAWFRSDILQASLITIEIPFTYGELASGAPSYMTPANGLFVDPAQVPYILPTHISFVASSSFDGAIFSGAVGSTLIIDDIEMIYE